MKTYRRGAAPYLEIDGRRLINFTSNNYLSLANHAAVIEGAVSAARDDGAGAGASRLITGTSPRIVELEQELAEWKGTARALVTTSGYIAALTALTALLEREDGVAVEKGAHACLVSGARLSGARLAVFRRHDPGSLDAALQKLRQRGARRLLVVCDGVHSMDGDIVPLPLLLESARRHDAMLLVDDAHATGVLGPDGAGTLSHFGISPAPDIIQMGTLSKALGSQGGYLAGSSELVDWLVQKSGPFIYTTGLAPVAVGASLAAIRVVRREPERLERLRANTLNLRSLLGLAESPSPILPMIVGEPAAALAAARTLEASGALALAIRPPTVPQGTARVRISVQADHELSDLRSNAPEWLTTLRSMSTETVMTRSDTES